ncbi:hydroxyacylglutathione hydrolase [Jannaschia pohangensis]|uniref:Hydroxyacylglutathione hydrolase n=1 Tax=Jannaschia pohangensis TaxID=390807 RepID=A0A1I3QMK8_9RHOB|nr:hydroxyacylglutathione hydrolase [Jannaschia pohangensis]SFJ34471.1 hydroxyacylglutathione hydrolase [Jannaschia pohangensis]
MTLADTLVTIPMLQDRFPDLLDNYGFLWRAGDRVVTVDAAKGDPILAAAAERGWTITDILLTHHHPDHVAGVADIVAATGAKVWGNRADAYRLPPLDHPLSPGDRIDIGGETGVVWDVSGHTIGHVAYIFDGIAFTGDSLMVGGCGRLFEGTPEQMHASLGQFAALPGDTLIASGHEYTAANIAFARDLEPDNPALTSRQEEVARLRATDTPTVPSLLSTERDTNPYLRVNDPALKHATKTRGRPDSATFAAIRRAKDAF